MFSTTGIENEISYTGSCRNFIFRNQVKFFQTLSLMALKNQAGEFESKEDITIENSPLESTGGKVWPASMRFEKFLQSIYSGNDSHRLSVLELGSGCGWLGMSLAQSFTSWDVSMSEQSSFGALDWLNHNIALNPLISVSSVELDWCQVSPDSKNRAWDLIIGCELVYSYIGARLLPSVIRELLTSKNSVCYYAHTMHRFPPIDQVFLAELARQSLYYEIVSGPKVLPDMQMELFPEMELVVFKIYLSYVLLHSHTV